MSQGMDLIAKILEDTNVTAFRGINRSEDIVGDEEVSAYEYVFNHFRRHAQLPTIDTVEQEADIEFNETPEPLSFYLLGVSSRYVYQESRSIFSELQEGIRESSVDDISSCAARLQRVCISRSVNRNEIATAAEISTDIYRRTVEQARADFVPTGYRYLDEETGGYRNGDLVVWVARSGVGKAQPLSSKVKTMDGWQLMGNIRVGDILASPDGAPSQVTGVFPQKGKRRVFEVTFQDGRSARVDKDHLWKVLSSSWKKPRILTTVELASLKSTPKYSGKGMLGVPLCTGDFGVPHDYLIDPYVMGCLLGDGCLVSKDIRFSSGDAFILDEIAFLIPGKLKKVKNKECDYSITCWRGLKPFLDHYRIRGLKSEEKFVPRTYLEGVKSTRLAVLQGLMDTDGSITVAGHAEFCSVSERLALEVIELIRSLGGKAKLSKRKLYKEYRQAYRVSIWATGLALFRLPRKAARVILPQKRNTNKLSISSIVEVDKESTQCISVSHHDSLYITDDYIVTHNTWSLICQALAAMEAGKSALFVSMEMTVEQISMRMAAYRSDLDPDLVRKGTLSEFGIRRLGTGIATFSGVDNFHIYSGGFNKKTSDIELLIQQLDPDVVYIDGMYLMKPASLTSRMGRYEAIAYVVDELKEATLRTNKPIICTTQFNRKAGKGGVDGSLENIGYTDTIGTHSSLIIAMQQGPKTMEPTYSQEEGEQRRIIGQKTRYHSRKYTLLKGREGESGSWATSFRFGPTNFREIPLSEVEAAEDTSPNGME